MDKVNSDLRFEKGRKTKDKILHSALEIICNNGIKGLSASKIAELAQISKSTVFHHFKTVEEIPFTILEQVGDTLTRELTAANHDNFKSYLYHLGEMTFNEESQNMMFFRALFSFYQTATFDPKYSRAVTKCSQSFKESINALIDSFYSVQEEKKNTISTLIYTTIDGLGMHYLIAPVGDNFLSKWYTFSDMIIRELER